MSEKQTKNLQQTSHFNLSQKIRYLRIMLTKRCSSLVADNYTKTYNQIKEDLKVWQKKNPTFFDGKNSSENEYPT